MPGKQLARVAVRILDSLDLELSRRPAAGFDEVLYGAYDAATLSRRPFINIGAGDFSHRYWTNVDYRSDYYADAQKVSFLNYDMTAEQPLPLEDESIELAYSSHTFEHVGDSAVENVMAECFRVLKPGGSLRVTCPDAALLYRTLKDDNRGFWHWRKRWYDGPGSNAASFDEVTLLDLLVREVATPLCRFYKHARAPVPMAELERRFAEMSRVDFLDSLTSNLAFDGDQPGNHINWWDEDKLSERLRAAGFRHVHASRRGQSMCPPMMGPEFDSTAPAMSLYLEASK